MSAGCVSFFFESERGLFPNTEYVYDLELPLDFIPFNSDGEVSSENHYFRIKTDISFVVLGPRLRVAAGS